MAHLVPEPLPEYVREDPLRAAERKVYEQLGRQLPRHFTVYYSRPWMGLSPDGREIDGEADFVVTHPDLGLLTIEVKGGAVSYDAATGIWRSRDRYDIRHTIKNPVEQARKSKHQILQKLKALPALSHVYIRACHGVVLPDSARPADDLGADMPLQIFAFEEDFQRLGQWVQARMASHLDESPGVAGRDLCDAVHKLLAHSFQLRTPLASLVRGDEQQIITLTEEQYQVLDGFEGHPRLAVSGGAGTGKTLLALEKARRLGTSGKQVLLTCFNRGLACHLRAIAGDTPHLTVLTFHELVSWYTGASPRKRQGATPDDGNDAQGAAQSLADVLLGAAETQPEKRFDAIIVDEGQDFAPDWFVPLELCLRDTRIGVFYVFYDDNQRLYRTMGSFAGAFPQAPFRLTRNLRNTRQIFRTASPFYGSGSTRAAGPEGRSVEFVEVPTQSDPPRIVSRLLERLVREDHLRPEDIAVLSGASADTSSIMGCGRLGSARPCRVSEVTSGCVVVDTVRRFKGLERSVVLLVELESTIDDLELLYVGITRARSHLIVIGQASQLDVIRRNTPPA